MHFHLPKPLHGWREFAGEVVIIVVGVLIALAAEQLVERWEWHRKIDSAAAAMRDELLFDDGPQVYQRVAMHPCIVDRLNAIRAAVENGSSRQQIGRLADAYWVDVRTFDRLALDAANASDVASHMPQDEIALFTTAYQRMPTMDRTNAQEGVDMARMRAFTRTGGAMTLDEKDRLLDAVEALRNDDHIMAVKGRVNLFELRKVGPLDAVRVRTFMADARDHYGDCVKPLPRDFPAGFPH